jgi:transcriptional regulator with XRE-family HTH domain
MFRMADNRERWLKAFGEVVRGLRGEQKLSQEELGRRCGLDRTYISGIERGVRNPTLLVLWRIAEGLETSPSELVRLTDARVG